MYWARFVLRRLLLLSFRNVTEVKWKLCSTWARKSKQKLLALFLSSTLAMHNCFPCFDSDNFFFLYCHHFMFMRQVAWHMSQLQSKRLVVNKPQHSTLLHHVCQVVWACYFCCCSYECSSQKVRSINLAETLPPTWFSFFPRSAEVHYAQSLLICFQDTGPGNLRCRYEHIFREGGEQLL